MSGPPRLGLYLCLLLLCSLTVGGSALASGGYSVEMDSAVPVPEETVQNPEDDSSEFTVSQVGTSPPGTSVAVDAAAPEGTSYFVFLRDEDGDIITRTDQLDEPQTVELDAGREPAGSYVVTIGPDSTPEEILPVVIEAYRVERLSLDGESSSVAGQFEIDSDDAATVSVQLDELEDQSISTVNLTIWNDERGTVKRIPLTEGDDLTYSGTLSGIDPGEYNIQVRIQGGTAVESGTFELIGLSENTDLTVTEPPTDDGSDGGGSDTTDGADSDNDSESSDEDGSNTTDGDGTADQSEDDDSTTDSTDENGTSDQSEGDGNADEDDTADGTDTSSDTADDSSQSDAGSDSVITPNSTNDTESSTDDSVPLNAIPGVFVLFLLFAGVRRMTGEP